MAVTADDLKRLPLRAIVAFAARCARRVQPLDRGAATTRLEFAIDFAERFAKDEEIRWHDAVDAGREAAVSEAEHVADAAANAADAASRVAKISDNIANADCAPNNLYIARDASARAVVTAAYSAAALAADAAASVSPLAADVSSSAANRDYKRLMELEPGNFPALGRPIDPTETGPLGPLWPNGEPEWYVHAKYSGITFTTNYDHLLNSVLLAESADNRRIAVYVDPGDAPQELITDFYLALSAYYAAHGGSGLRFAHDERRQLVLAEVDQ